MCTAYCVACVTDVDALPAKAVLRRYMTIDGVEMYICSRCEHGEPVDWHAEMMAELLAEARLDISF